MRLGTKILLLTLAATVGLSGTVIWVVSHDVTAHEVARARRTIKWAVSGYFQSVEERHQRDTRLAHLVIEDSNTRPRVLSLEDGDAQTLPFAQTQLVDEIFNKLLQSFSGFRGVHVFGNRR